jgi:tetratricopeptide (TPR) repeat protein
MNQMKKILLATTLILTQALCLYAQDIQFYESESDKKHIWGPFPVDYLKQDTTYAGWFNESYEAFEMEKKDYKWVKNLEDKQVDIFIGTWCGDTQNYVPKFLNMWDQLGLKREQLNFIALHDSDSLYKQGPNREEKGLNIHRVPTFIFKKDGKEVARIVEFPNTDLVTDLAQIALGYPPAPSYRCANYFLDLFDQMTVDSIYKDGNKHFYAGYSKVAKYNELNTLGKVLMQSDRLQEALLVYSFNTSYYRYNPSVNKSFAKALDKVGNYVSALQFYETAFRLDPEDEKVAEEIARLKVLVDKQKEQAEAGGE